MFREAFDVLQVLVPVTNHTKVCSGGFVSHNFRSNFLICYLINSSKLSWKVTNRKTSPDGKFKVLSVAVS